MIRRVPTQDMRSGGGAQKVSTVTMPAAVTGLNTVTSLAAMKPTDALVLENWICRPDKLIMRKGTDEYTTDMTSPIRSLGVFSGKAARRMFAFCDDGIFDVSGGGAVGSAVSTITDGNAIVINYATSASQYLVAVNGRDPYRYYDGSDWTEVATFTYDSGVFLTRTINNIAAYKQRLFFAANNDLNLYYLDPNGTIQGTVKAFPLGLVCTKGGYLVSMLNWTIDSGNGPDDRFVLITSEGEVVVYNGTDPGDATRWALEGVYYVGRPLGKKCLTKHGGDVLMLTERGLFPISRIVQSELLQRTDAFTYNIETEFARLASALFNRTGWEVSLNFAQSILIVNIPDSEPFQLVMQLQSGGWSKFTGWPANCFVMYSGEMYFGSTDHLAHCFYGSTDYGDAIVAVEQLAYNYFNARGQIKDIKLVRPIFESEGEFEYSLGFSVDYEGIDADTLSAQDFTLAGYSLWGSAVWGTSTWSNSPVTKAAWDSPACPPATAISMYVRISSVGAQVSHIGTDVGYLLGGVL